MSSPHRAGLAQQQLTSALVGTQFKAFLAPWRVAASTFTPTQVEAHDNLHKPTQTYLDVIEMSQCKKGFVVLNKYLYIFIIRLNGESFTRVETKVHNTNTFPSTTTFSSYHLSTPRHNLPPPFTPTTFPTLRRLKALGLLSPATP